MITYATDPGMSWGFVRPRSSMVFKVELKRLVKLGSCQVGTAAPSVGRGLQAWSLGTCPWLAMGHVGKPTVAILSKPTGDGNSPKGWWLGDGDERSFTTEMADFSAIQQVPNRSNFDLYPHPSEYPILWNWLVNIGEFGIYLKYIGII
jgi:hypothetical protein